MRSPLTVVFFFFHTPPVALALLSFTHTRTHTIIPPSDDDNPQRSSKCFSTESWSCKQSLGPEPPPRLPPKESLSHISWSLQVGLDGGGLQEGGCRGGKGITGPFSLSFAVLLRKKKEHTFCLFLFWFGSQRAHPKKNGTHDMKRCAPLTHTLFLSLIHTHIRS